MRETFFYTIELPLGIEVDGSFVAEDGWLDHVYVGRDNGFDPQRLSVPRTEVEIIQQMIVKIIERKYSDDILSTSRVRADVAPIYR